MTLTEQYLDLVNQQLPEAARHGHYPVRHNHCFARIILDAVCGCPWYEALERPAYQHLSEAQMRAAIALAQTFLNNPQACHAANHQSLAYRGKRD
jgi:hypothetical protein